MAANPHRKSSSGIRPPPPPIAESTSPIEIYDTIEAYEPPPSQPLPSRQARNRQNRRSLPPVPLADDNDYNQPYDRDEAEEYEEPDEIDPRQRRPDQRSSQYYIEPETNEDYYADTIVGNRNSYIAEPYGTDQQDYPNRYGVSPRRSYPQEAYEDLPEYDDRSRDPRDDPYGYQPRKPVDRNQSRKKMGRAIVTGLNTARVKEIRDRLRPAFGPDELIDSVESRSSVSEKDEIENIDVSKLSVAERMKLLEAKAAKKVPPPTYPKPRLSKGNVQEGVGVGIQAANPSKRASYPSVIREENPAAIPSNRSQQIIVTPPNPNSQSPVDESPWYFGNYDYPKCEEKLRNLNKEGAFLIRMSKKGETRMQPYTLCVYHDGDIYNFMVRCKQNTKLAVGSEKNGEPEFNNLAELVKFHADVAIEVVPRNKTRKSSGLVWLTMSPLK